MSNDRVVLRLDLNDFGDDVLTVTIDPEALSNLLVTKLQRVFGDGEGDRAARAAKIPDLRAKARVVCRAWLQAHATKSLNQSFSQVLFGDLFTRMCPDEQVLGFIERESRDTQLGLLARPAVSAALDRLLFGADKTAAHRVQRLFESFGKLPSGRKRVALEARANVELVREFERFEQAEHRTKAGRIAAFAKTKKRNTESVRVALSQGRKAINQSQFGKQG
jgi:hypothetical protein